jgi:hypothetical protein
VGEPVKGRSVPDACAPGITAIGDQQVVKVNAVQIVSTRGADDLHPTGNEMIRQIAE